MSQHTLTAHALAEFRRPFTANAVKFKVQTETKTEPRKGMATFYIDSRLAVERLNAVAGPEHWSDAYRVLTDGSLMAAHHFPVECALTVLGVTKVDVGVYQKAQPDSMAWKSAYSDALKRAAVKFSIGAYLYALPKAWAPVKVGQNGKTVGFTPEGEKQLRQMYERWLKSGQPFGDALDHGDVGDDEAPHDEREDLPYDAPIADQPSDDEMRALIAKAKERGYQRDQIATLLENEREQHGAYRRLWWDEQMAFLTKAAA